MTLNNYNYMLVFDFETTGLSPFTNNIIEIGALLLKNVGGIFEIEEELSVLIKQEEPLDPKITEITNITDEMLHKDGISELEAFLLFDQLMSKQPLLVAYNISFDYGFLTTLYRRYKQQHNFFITNDMLDVMAIYKDRHPFPHRLESASKTYNVYRDDAHRALEDVKMTYDVLMKMQQEKDHLNAYVNVIGYNPKYGPSNFKAPHVVYKAQDGRRLKIVE